MASILESTKLVMKDNYGVVEGKTVVKSHTFSKIKSNADDSALFELAQAIDGLNTPTCDEVKAVRTTSITE